MSYNGPFRVINTRKKSLGFAKEKSNKEELSFYFSRVLKLIPSDVIALYLFGANIIPFENKFVLLGWSIFCFSAVLISRILGTKNENKNSTQWVVVFISSISFIIWIYLIGGPFRDFNIHIPYVGALAMAGWTFLIPYLYKGDTQ